jgi:hypothetical protein
LDDLGGKLKVTWLGGTMRDAAIAGVLKVGMIICQFGHQVHVCGAKH